MAKRQQISIFYVGAHGRFHKGSAQVDGLLLRNGKDKLLHTMSTDPVMVQVKPAPVRTLQEIEGLLKLPPFLDKSKQFAVFGESSFFGAPYPSVMPRHSGLMQ